MPIINGVRLGLGVAIIGTLLAETKLSNRGIGFLIIHAYSPFDMPRMYAHADRAVRARRSASMRWSGGSAGVDSIKRV